ncbi:MAG: DNA helicase RecQ [Candidatus Cloacimonetes bacterium 4572_55]|nr:MAG: DNA helicase RecQ [Candidatus Cloacimonetes bacterium 4572_55]
MLKKSQNILKQVFGYEEFRSLQAEIIENVLQKKDTLVIMPTGSGKSLCYQIPALIFKGLTVVVSPLISLMKDQVEQMKQLGVRALFLNSSLSPGEYNRTLQQVVKNEVDLLYVSPETLLKPDIKEILSDLKIDSLTIDEAHCISEWGHDFRPEYRQIAGVRSSFPQAVCIALTATATKQVRKDIKASLAFDQSSQFLDSFDRENLYLSVEPKTDPAAQAIRFITQHPRESGIIYCTTRRTVDDLSEILIDEGFSVLPYHAGLEDQVRSANQEKFIRDDVSIIVATIAFGMGINKSNVRYVLHLDLPKNIESYYQQIGRAGRDGLKADCLLLLGYGDISKIKYFMKEKDERESRLAQAQLDAMLRYAESDGCRRKPLLSYFGETYEPDDCDMCDNCRNDDIVQEDITVLAQKFLSCVYRTGQFFGAGHIIDVLRGSKSKKVLHKNHDKLSTYGIGADYTKKQWFHLSRQFITKGLLGQDPEYGSLKLTDKAWEILKNGAKIFGKIEAAPVANVKQPEVMADHDSELFEELRTKRKEIAERIQLPPYVIFHDSSLADMATRFPQTKEGMLATNGMGQRKWEQFGDEFMHVICEYCEERGISPQPYFRPKRSLSLRKLRHHQVGEMFNDGVSIPDIMATFNIKETTVLSYLTRFVLDGHKLSDPSMILKSSKLSQNQQKDVFETFDRFGFTGLSPAYEVHQKQISYDELRILKLYRLCQ